MLGKRIEQYKPNIWLVNTGWTAGPYGVGSRIKLAYTRALITAAMNGSLNNVAYQTHEIFGLQFPISCHGVPSDLLNPKNTWIDKEAYDQKANALAELFIHNFEKYKSKADDEMLAAAPKMLVGN